MTRKDRKPKPREIAREALRSIEVSDGSILLVKEGTPIATQSNVNALARRLSVTDRKNCIVLVVADVNGDIRALDKEILNEYGWIRATEPDQQSSESTV